MICNLDKRSVAVKCKKNCILKCKIFFYLKWPNSSRKPIKKFLHFKMLTLQNQGGKGGLTWQFSYIHETITTEIFKKIIKIFIHFLEISDGNNF